MGPRNLSGANQRGPRIDAFSFVFWLSGIDFSYKYASNLQQKCEGTVYVGVSIEGGKSEFQQYRSSNNQSNTV